MTNDLLSYQNLDVYRNIIHFIASVEQQMSRWDRPFAILNHLPRAYEGALICLAEACRSHRLPSKRQAADCSAGSILECAACLDIAQARSLCNSTQSNELKAMLGAIFRQLIALRESWQQTELREDSLSYGERHIFNHEFLHVYQLSLKLNHLIESSKLFERLFRRDFRGIDEAGTSIVLNIAEGNGRFSHLDHGRFLDIANQSNTKLAARIEVCSVRGAISNEKASEFFRMLARIDQMTAKLAERWRNEGR